MITAGPGSGKFNNGGVLKSKMVLLITILLLSIILFNYCESSTEADGDEVIMPLVVGNTWKYHHWMISDGDTIQSPQDVYFSIVDKKMLKNFDSGQLEEFWILNDGAETTTCLRNTPEGLYWGISYPESNEVGTVMFYKYPVSYSDVYSHGGIKVTVSQQTVTSISGEKYVCYKYSWPSGYGYDTENYFDPGVGLVRMRIGDNNKWFDLISYTLH